MTGTELRAERLQALVSGADLARAWQVTRQYVSSVERLQIVTPTSAMLYRRALTIATGGEPGKRIACPCCGGVGTIEEGKASDV